MKKIFIYLFGLLIAFASCAKIEEMSFEDLRNNAPQEIVFNMDAVKVTKSAVNTINDLVNFGVYGYIYDNGTNKVSDAYIMENAQYYGYGTDGTNLGKAVNTKYYWPKSDVDDIRGSFVAFHPYKSTGITRNNDNIKYDIAIASTEIFELAKNATNDMVDVMYAVNNGYKPEYPTTVNQKTDDITDVTGKTNPQLNFKHALSLIQFQGAVDNLTAIKSITINSITFKDANGNSAALKNEGSLQFDRNTTTNEFKLTSPATELNPIILAAIPATSTEFDYAKFHTTDLASYKATAAPNNYKSFGTSVIIPQDVPAKVVLDYTITLQYKDANNTVEYQNRTVTRTINTGNNDENGYNTDNPDDHAATAIAGHNHAFPGIWKAGYVYVYRYFITLDEIQFEVSVTPWENNTQWNQIWDVDGSPATVF